MNNASRIWINRLIVISTPFLFAICVASFKGPLGGFLAFVVTALLLPFPLFYFNSRILKRQFATLGATTQRFEANAPMESERPLSLMATFAPFAMMSVMCILCLLFGALPAITSIILGLSSTMFAPIQYFIPSVNQAELRRRILAIVDFAVGLILIACGVLSEPSLYDENAWQQTLMIVSGGAFLLIAICRFAFRWGESKKVAERFVDFREGGLQIADILLPWDGIKTIERKEQGLQSEFIVRAIPFARFNDLTAPKPQTYTFAVWNRESAQVAELLAIHAPRARYVGELRLVASGVNAPLVQFVD